MVSSEPIRRQQVPIEPTADGAAVNLKDYPVFCREFSWERLRAELVDRTDDKMNIAARAIDRPAAIVPDKLAVRFIDAEYGNVDLTYGGLLQRANQFANLMRRCELPRGAVVASLLGRCPELFAVVLGTLKAGAVFSPLFSAFGPEPIRSRLELSGAAVLVTTLRLYERKVAPIRAQLPLLRHVLLILAASGMATGGRVVHHLKVFVPDARNLILFAGFQAGGTRGASMVAGAKAIRIHGEMFPVRAEVEQLSSASAHADAAELIGWLKHLPAPRQVFVTHGEAAASDALRQRIQTELGWRVSVPEYRDDFELAQVSAARYARLGRSHFPASRTSVIDATATAATAGQGGIANLNIAAIAGT